MENFTGESAGQFTFRDFGDFSAQLFKQNSNYKPRITTDGRLRIQERNHKSYLQLNFDYNIQSLGFKWWNTDQNGDALELIIGSNVWTFGPAKSSGFFGVVASSGYFNTAAFSDTPSGN